MSDKEESDKPTSGTPKRSPEGKPEKFSHIGDTKNQSDELRKGAEIPPRPPKVRNDDTKDKQ
ncbi:MAG TPA: hypothetical protein VF691_19030 [Cytophagaceae bacterium]|jgi:hypothetical protein